MTTPVEEKAVPFFDGTQRTQSSDEEGTVFGEAIDRAEHTSHPQTHSRLRVTTTHDGDEAFRHMQSPSQTREQAHRLDDELTMLQIERQVSRATEHRLKDDQSMGKSMHRERSRRTEEPLDDFDVATNPLHERAQLYRPPEHPATNFSKLVKRIHHSSIAVRYFMYITPVLLILLVPLLVGALLPGTQSVAGVKLKWFSVWLVVVWLTLWAGRVSDPHNLPSVMLRLTICRSSQRYSLGL